MAVQTVVVEAPWMLNPFAVDYPFFYQTGQEFDIDDDGWVDLHSSQDVNNVEIVPP
jgi:hypothetical protein